MSEQNSSKVNFFLGLFAGMAVVAVIGFVAMLGVVFSEDGASDKVAVQPAQAQPTQPTQPAAPEKPAAGPLPAISGEDYVYGNKNATVEVVEYTDFECPFCSRHHDTMTQVKNTYGDRIKYVLRHFPLSFHASAQKAAESAECAGEQGKYFEMTDRLFELNTAKDMGVPQFKKAAQDLGLNSAKFATCLDNGTYAAKVKKSAAGGQSAGVEGTPATFINGKLVSGAVPFENFQQILDGLLK